MFNNQFQNKTVLITGHTGFKGSWLTLWLTMLGAKVVGYSLAKPPSDPSLFQLIQLSEQVEDQRGDICDLAQLKSVVQQAAPDVVMHLAAQPLVRLSYQQPLETLETNVMGTANLLEAVRAADRPCVVIAVTSDKCYENVDWEYGYRETDPLGGSDPYSMSKGAAELVIRSWRRSYFGVNSPVQLASVRAGNVIGGGDWAEDRLVPDCIAALQNGRTIPLRNPQATRPWQHVLEPLGGYLWLASKMLEDSAHRWDTSWNFGPALDSVQPVQRLIQLLIHQWGCGQWEDLSDPQAVREARLLALNWDKAFHQLSWQPTWSLDQCVEHTVAWYKAWDTREGDLRTFTEQQIATYAAAARQRNIPWAT